MAQDPNLPAGWEVVEEASDAGLPQGWEVAEAAASFGEGDVAAIGAQAVNRTTPALRAAVSGGAKFVAKTPAAQKAIAVGVPAMVGSPFGAVESVLGGMLGSSRANLVKKIAEAVSDAAGTSMPRKAGQFATLPTGRATVNRLFSLLKTATGPATSALLASAEANQRLNSPETAAMLERAMTGNLPELPPNPKRMAQPAQPPVDAELLEELLKRSR